jgi:hypothetical protein
MGLTVKVTVQIHDQLAELVGVELNVTENVVHGRRKSA